MLRPKNLNFWTLLLITGIIAVFSLFLLVKEKVLAGDSFGIQGQNTSNLPVFQEISFLPLPTMPFHNSPVVAERIKVIVTAYSSSVWETQGDPFITASGERVRDGIIANNLLPFGTKVRLPKLFGNKVFTVKDRMNPRKGYYHVDIWFPSRQAALEFGSKITEMEILQ